MENSQLICFVAVLVAIHLITYGAKCSNIEQSSSAELTGSQMLMKIATYSSVNRDVFSALSVLEKHKPTPAVTIDDYDDEWKLDVGIAFCNYIKWNNIDHYEKQELCHSTIFTFRNTLKFETILIIPKLKKCVLQKLTVSVLDAKVKISKYGDSTAEFNIGSIISGLRGFFALTISEILKNPTTMALLKASLKKETQKLVPDVLNISSNCDENKTQDTKWTTKAWQLFYKLPNIGHPKEDFKYEEMIELSVEGQQETYICYSSYARWSNLKIVANKLQGTGNISENDNVVLKALIFIKQGSKYTPKFIKATVTIIYFYTSGRLIDKQLQMREVNPIISREITSSINKHLEDKKVAELYMASLHQAIKIADIPQELRTYNRLFTEGNVCPIDSQRIRSDNIVLRHIGTTQWYNIEKFTRKDDSYYYTDQSNLYLTTWLYKTIGDRMYKELLTVNISSANIKTGNDETNATKVISGSIGKWSVNANLNGDNDIIVNSYLEVEGKLVSLHGFFNSSLKEAFNKFLPRTNRAEKFGFSEPYYTYTFGTIGEFIIPESSKPELLQLDTFFCWRGDLEFEINEDGNKIILKFTKYIEDAFYVTYGAYSKQNGEYLLERADIGSLIANVVIENERIVHIHAPKFVIKFNSENNESDSNSTPNPSDLPLSEVKLKLAPPRSSSVKSNLRSSDSQLPSKKKISWSQEIDEAKSKETQMHFELSLDQVSNIIKGSFENYILQTVQSAIQPRPINVTSITEGLLGSKANVKSINGFPYFEINSKRYIFSKTIKFYNLYAYKLWKTPNGNNNDNNNSGTASTSSNNSHTKDNYNKNDSANGILYRMEYNEETKLHFEINVYPIDSKLNAITIPLYINSLSVNWHAMPFSIGKEAVVINFDPNNVALDKNLERGVLVDNVLKVVQPLAFKLVSNAIRDMLKNQLGDDISLSV